MMEVNLNNLKNNVRELTKDNRQLIGVVKNNAYGCGALKISEHLVKCGVRYLLVNDISEASLLLENKIDASIIVFNGLHINDYAWIDKYQNLVISINSLNDCLSLNEYCHTPIRVHIQIDTGLNRLGIKNEKEFDEVLNILKSNDKFIIEGIFTHFASPEQAIMQLEKFKLFANKYDFKMIHCASSNTISTIDYGNYIRCGLALYDLTPVMSIKVYPLTIRRVLKGETLGYHFEYTASEDMIIAVLPIGYGNGYRLAFQNFFVYAEKNYYQVVGRICMNHIFVKVDELVNLNTEFELMSCNLPASQLAKYAKTSTYEIYTSWHLDKVKYYE